MSDAERYRECLLHVINWVGGLDQYGHLQSLDGRSTYRIALAVKAVLDGKTTQQAVEEANGK